MTRKRPKSDACLLCEFEPKSMKYALENEDWIQAMNEENEHIEKNKTRSLVSRAKDKMLL